MNGQKNMIRVTKFLENVNEKKKKKERSILTFSWIILLSLLFFFFKYKLHCWRTAKIFVHTNAIHIPKSAILHKILSLMELKCSITTVFIPVYHETTGIDKTNFRFERYRNYRCIKRTLILRMAIIERCSHAR